MHPILILHNKYIVRKNYTKNKKKKYNIHEKIKKFISDKLCENLI